MICPYNLKTSTEVQSTTQTTDADGVPEKSRTVTQARYEYMECLKDECGAWQDGKCRYVPFRI